MKNEDNAKIPEDDSKHIPNKAKTMCAAAIHPHAKEQHILFILHTASKQASVCLRDAYVMMQQ